MYVASIAALMLVFPLTSIGIQTISGGPGMLTAALLAQPHYTAEQILGIKDPDATLIVRELGFANTAIDKHRNRLQSFAMASDLFAAAVLLLCLSSAAHLRA